MLRAKNKINVGLYSEQGGRTTTIPARPDPTTQHLDAPRSTLGLREYQGSQPVTCGIVVQLSASDLNNRCVLEEGTHPAQRPIQIKRRNRKL